MRKQKKYHYIYRTTCQVTGKFYVGMHSTDILDDGYLGSGKILGYSVAKHGAENHKREILEFLPDRVALKLREAEIVNEEMLTDPLNMNLKYGGDGGWDHRNNDAAVQSANGIRGNAKIRSLRENNPEWVAKVKATLSEGVRLAYKEGRKIAVLPDWSGRKHRAETLAKLSAKAKERTGEKNSQFGTCWVCNAGGPKKIKQSELDEHLRQGFKRGRK